MCIIDRSETRSEADTEITSLLDMSFDDLASESPEPLQDLPVLADDLIDLDGLLAPGEVDALDPLAEHEDTAWLDLPLDVSASTSTDEPDVLSAFAPESVNEPAAVPEAEAVPEPAPELEAETQAEADSDEQIRVIGDLRIGIPLYNVYLNEADEWSRRLLTEVTEWSLELDQPCLLYTSRCV